MMLAFRVWYLIEREHSHGKCTTLFILACCFDTAFIPIRITLSDFFFFLTTLSLPVDSYTCDSLRRELTPSNNFILSRPISLFFIISLLFPALQAVCSTRKLVSLVQKVLDWVNPGVAWKTGKTSLFIHRSSNKWWCCTGLGPWGRSFCLCSAGFQRCQSRLLVGTAIYSSLLRQQRRSEWPTWPLGLWKGKETP